MLQAELEQELSKLPAPRVTKETIEARIKTTRYVSDDLTTICVIELDNGFKVLGHSTPANAENFRVDIGRHYAYDHAFRQLWQLLGFALVELKYVQANAKLALQERESQP